MHIEDN